MARSPHPDNRVRWAVGTLVIHRGDAKMSCMLMRVIGYTEEGLAQTQYVAAHCRDFEKSTKKVWTNDIADLLYPADFGIKLGDENDQKYSPLST